MNSARFVDSICTKIAFHWLKEQNNSKENVCQITMDPLATNRDVEKG